MESSLLSPRATDGAPIVVSTISQIVDVGVSPTKLFLVNSFEQYETLDFLGDSFRIFDRITMKAKGIINLKAKNKRICQFTLFIW